MHSFVDVTNQTSSSAYVGSMDKKLSIPVSTSERVSLLKRRYGPHSSMYVMKLWFGDMQIYERTSLSNVILIWRSWKTVLQWWMSYFTARLTILTYFSPRHTIYSFLHSLSTKETFDLSVFMCVQVLLRKKVIKNGRIPCKLPCFARIEYFNSQPFMNLKY